MADTEARLPLSHRIAGLDCYYCEDGEPHRHCIEPSKPADPNEVLVDALIQAHEALRCSYNVQDYPAYGRSTQDIAMGTIEYALSSVGKALTSGQ